MILIAMTCVTTLFLLIFGALASNADARSSGPLRQLELKLEGGGISR